MRQRGLIFCPYFSLTGGAIDLQTAILHRWSGRVIWAFATGHAIAWFYQLSQDRDPFGRMVLIPVFGWWRFVAGVIVRRILTFLVPRSQFAHVN